jgi:hypothetical protein
MSLFLFLLPVSGVLAREYSSGIREFSENSATNLRNEDSRVLMLIGVEISSTLEYLRETSTVPPDCEFACDFQKKAYRHQDRGATILFDFRPFFSAKRASLDTRLRGLVGQNLSMEFAPKIVFQNCKSAILMVSN